MSHLVAFWQPRPVREDALHFQRGLPDDGRETEHTVHDHQALVAAWEASDFSRLQERGREDALVF